MRRTALLLLILFVPACGASLPPEAESAAKALAAEVSREFAELEDETSARLHISLNWEDRSFTSKTCQPNKEGDKWYIDGAGTLSVMELK